MDIISDRDLETKERVWGRLPLDVGGWWSAIVDGRRQKYYDELRTRGMAYKYTDEAGACG